MDLTFGIFLVTSLVIASWKWSFVAYVLGGVIAYISSLLIVSDLANHDDFFYGEGITFGIAGCSASLVLVAIAITGRSVRRSRAERARVPEARLLAS